MAIMAGGSISIGEGWLHMCAIEDLLSRRIIGWAIRPYLAVDLAAGTLYGLWESMARAKSDLS